MGPVFFLLTHVIVVHCSHVCRKGIHLFDVDNKRIRHALQLSVGSSSRRRPGSPGLPPPPRGRLSAGGRVRVSRCPVGCQAAHRPTSHRSSLDVLTVPGRFGRAWPATRSPRGWKGVTWAASVTLADTVSYGLLENKDGDTRRGPQGVILVPLVHICPVVHANPVAPWDAPWPHARPTVLPFLSGF